MTQPTDLKQYLAYLADSMRGSRPEQIAALDPKRRNLVLAARFEYDVRKGGFAQFFYNMHGELLGEVEDMLLAANAAVAHDSYIQAVQVCIANPPEYQRFIGSAYTEENEVKNGLHKVTLAYFAKKTPFLVEANAYLVKVLPVS